MKRKIVIYNVVSGEFDIHSDVSVVATAIGMSYSGLSKALKRGSVYRRGDLVIGYGVYHSSLRGSRNIKSNMLDGKGEVIAIDDPLVDRLFAGIDGQVNKVYAIRVFCESAGVPDFAIDYGKRYYDMDYYNELVEYFETN